MHRHAILPVVAATIALYASPAAAQPSLTFVSSTGSDASQFCLQTAPCRTFSGAHAKTLAGGEIRCLNTSDFGTVTITKSITIDCAGTGAVTQSQGLVFTQIDVNAADIIVNLRNMTLSPNVTSGTGIGINFTQGAVLNLHNVTIHGMNIGSGSGGIKFQPTTANSTLLVTNSTITLNGVPPSLGAGIAIQPVRPGSARVTIENSKIQFNSNGIAANSTNGPITMTVRD